MIGASRYPIICAISVPVIKTANDFKKSLFASFFLIRFSIVLKDALKCGKPMLITMHKRSRNPLLQSIRKRDDLRTLEVTPINSAILPSKAVNILKTGMV